MHILYSFIFVILISFPKKKIFRHLTFISLAFLFSKMSEEVSPDYDGYLLLYTDPFTSWISENTEFGFLFLNLFFGQLLSVDYSTFLILLTFVLMECWYYATKKVIPYELIGFSFLIFVSYNGYFYLCVALRNICSLSLCLIALTYYLKSSSRNKNLLYIILVILSMAFHRSSFLFLIVPFLDKFKLNKRMVSWWLIIDVVVLIIGGLAFLASFSRLFLSIGGLDKYENHFGVTQGINLFSVWFLMNIIINFILIFGRKYILDDYKNSFDFFLKLLLFGMTLHCFAWQMEIVQRLAGAFYFFNYIPLSILIFKSSLFKTKLLRRSLSVCLASFSFVVLLYCQSFFLFY